MSTILMNKKMFKDAYGDHDFADVDFDSYGNIKFLYIKIKRALKEAL